MSFRFSIFFIGPILEVPSSPKLRVMLEKGALPKRRLRKCPNILHAIVCFTNLGLPVGVMQMYRILDSEIFRDKCNEERVCPAKHSTLTNKLHS